jgi:hypothetical protein
VGLASERDAIAELLLCLLAESLDLGDLAGLAGRLEVVEALDAERVVALPDALGPSPSTLVSAAISTGYSSRSASSSSMVPVSTYSTTFAEMASPTPSMVATASAPSSASPSMAAVVSRMFSAARR